MSDMTKVAEIVRFYSLDQILDFINNGGEYPLHHLWCYDKIKEHGIPVYEIEYEKNSKLNRIGLKLKIGNLQQQINLLRRSNEFDLIYAPFISDIFLIALFKVLGIYKKPVLGLAVGSHVPFKKHFLKRLREKILRGIYSSGIDCVLYFNKTIFDQSNSYKSLNGNHDYTDTWGADLDFFNSFIKRQDKPPSLDFIYSTGGSQRDFKTLIKAFNSIDFNLKITTKIDEGLNGINRPNIIIDNTIKPGLNSVGIIRNDYYNSLAVAIPLIRTAQKWPVGITVIMEALAMGKPIISTKNVSFPFDLEKERIGLYVDYEDVEGWREHVNFLVQNTDLAKEMGERGKFLCEKKYNYNRFSKEVILRIEKFLTAKN